MAHKKVLVCTPLNEEPTAAPGDIKMACAECGELVWISPSSWTILHDNPGTEVICTGCASKLQATARTVRTHKPTPSQLDEIEERLEDEDGEA